MTNERGQLIVEFVIGVAVWAALAGGFVFLVQMSLVRQRAHAAARLGTFLLAGGRVSDETARHETQMYVERLSNGNTWKIETGRFMETAASRFYRMVQTRVSTGSGGQQVRERVVAQQEAKL